MKKVLFVTIMVISILLTGCLTASANKLLTEEFTVFPDPDNPFQGTWTLGHGNALYIHRIEGMEGVLYVSHITLFSFGPLNKTLVYSILEAPDGGYITSNHWRISARDGFLTVGDMVYERVIIREQ